MNESELLNKVKELTNQGLSAQMEGDNKKALDYYKKALDLKPNFLITKNNLANLYNSMEKYSIADNLLNEVLLEDSEYIHALYNKGISSWRLGRVGEAINFFRKVINKNQNYLDAYLFLGLMYSKIEEFVKAIQVYKIALSKSPNSLPFLNNLAIAYLDLGRKEKAEEIFKHILKINPGFTNALTGLALLYLGEEKYDLVLSSCKKALKYEPDNYLAYMTISEAYFKTMRFKEGIITLKLALNIKPHATDPVVSLYEGYRNICDWDNAEKIAKKKEFIDGVGSWLSIIHTENQKQNYLASVRDANNILQNVGRKYNQYKKKGERIKIGYLSADFRDHPVGHLVHTMFRHHNRNKYEVVIFSYGKDDKTIFRKNIENTSDKFIDLFGLSAPKISEIINREGVDILIDLMGYTHDAKPEILAAKPAPVQIQFLGYPGTSGSKYVDYLIADKTTIPKSDEIYYSEKILRMPNSFMVTDDTIPKMATKISKKDFDLPEGKIILSSFSAPIKIDKTTFMSWMRIMKNLKDSVLWLRDAGFYAQDNLKSFASTQGINPKRIIFSKRIKEKEKHLERLKLVDIGLDTFIYGGHTTTSDFLWAGVPVVTIRGKHFASRVAASILYASGLKELVVQNTQEYEKLIIELGRNKKKLEKIKEKIMQNQKTQSFFSTKKFVEDFESLLASLYSRCNR